MSNRPTRVVAGQARRTKPVRRRSAGLTPVRAGAILAMLLAAAAVYGLAATSAFTFTRIELRGATLVDEATVRARLGIPAGANLFGIQTEPIEARLRAIPSVSRADVSVSLPDTISVEVAERQPIVVWHVGGRRLLVDRDGMAYAELDSDPPPAVAALPVVDDARAVSRRLAVGAGVDPVDLDAATRLASLSPADVGSAAARLKVGVTDENGFVLTSEPNGWSAVFGFYGRSLRTPELIPGQVQLLASLLAGREATVGQVILADDRDGTYLPKASTAPSRPSPGAKPPPSP
jgi:cell division septal protein FtsQ